MTHATNASGDAAGETSAAMAAEISQVSLPPHGLSAPRWSELARLRNVTRFYDAVIEEIDGRRIRIGEHWLADFASCNYLGFDLDPEIKEIGRASCRERV